VIVRSMVLDGRQAERGKSLTVVVLGQWSVAGDDRLRVRAEHRSDVKLRERRRNDREGSARWRVIASLSRRLAVRQPGVPSRRRAISSDGSADL